MINWKEKLPGLERFRYPLLILLLGIGLMLVPTGNRQPAESGAEAQLEQILSCSEGVGQARVILSEKGVVVVCQGAANARTRLEILQAVRSYTGFGSDKITVLKMAK